MELSRLGLKVSSACFRMCLHLVTLRWPSFRARTRSKSRNGGCSRVVPSTKRRQESTTMRVSMQSELSYRWPKHVLRNSEQRPRFSETLKSFYFCYRYSVISLLNLKHTDAIV